MRDPLYSVEVFRTPNMIDDANRGALGIDVATSFPAVRVIAFLSQMIDLDGRPSGHLSAWIGKTQRSDIDFVAVSHAVGARHPALPAALRLRLASAYGSHIELVLTGGLGAEVAAGLHEAELNHLHRHEWARSADDVVWRHSELGLHYSAAQRGAVADWCAIDWPRPAARGAARQAERAWS